MDGCRRHICQGSALSPLLFITAMDGIKKDAKATECERMRCNRGNILFTDDLVTQGVKW